MQIGEKIKQMRVALGLTQEELAARTELTKGFISQLERDMSSPSIATLTDILEALGSDLASFFSHRTAPKVIYRAADMFEKEDAERGNRVLWLIANAQKKEMEPILLTLDAQGQTEPQDPHEGEEFGYVLSGAVTLCDGENKYRLKKGDSFYLTPMGVHYMKNSGDRQAKVLWVSAPPSF
ncbi:MAG: cupin domain-containing protein [Clostridiales bacterium]|nr:cupin domain-containing protein [Clostridiales bacterium]